MTDKDRDNAKTEPVEYEQLAGAFNDALLHTLRKHSVADAFLDFWVPDSDPVLGIAGMVDSARIAGLTGIAIRFRKTTVPADQLPELQQMLAGTCTIAVTDEGDTLLLNVTNMRVSFAPIVERRGAAVKSIGRQADVIGDVGSPFAKRWSTTELPEFGEVHPYFRPALNVRMNRLTYEKTAQSPRSGFIQVSGRENSATLTLAVDAKTRIVREACHFGAQSPSDRAVLDLFCEAARNLPIQEVADHTGLRVLNSLIDPDSPPPIRGILLPANAGAPFALPARLARQAYKLYCTQTGITEGINFYAAPPSHAWQALSNDQRHEKANELMRAFLQSEGLYPDDMSVIRIEKNKNGFEVRAIVRFSDRIAVQDKPALMRRLERRARRDLEPEIDLVAERAKDTSPLRRLS